MKPADGGNSAGEARQGALRSLLGKVLALDGHAAQLRSLLLNAIVILMLAMSIPILIRELTRDSVVIESLSVPEALSGAGYTGDVVAERLWDAWTVLNRKAATAKETRDVLPTSRQIEFSIPDSGLSFESFIHHLRDFLGIGQTRISGELVCPTANCTITEAALRLRITGREVRMIELPQRGPTPENDYWQRAISDVLLTVDPVRGIMALRLAGQGDDGNDERAVAELMKLVRSHHPERDWAEAYAGSLLEGLGDTTAALARFDAVLARNPRFVFALRLKSQAELDSGKGAEARETIEKALRIAPRDPLLHMQHARVESGTGHPDAALAALDKAGMLDPNNIAIALQRGSIFMAGNDTDMARNELEKVIAIAPEHREAREFLALISSLSGDTAGAVRQQQVVVRVAPGDAQALAALALYQQRAGSPADADATIAKALAAGPPTASLLQQQASLLRLQQKPAQSVEVLQKALALEPGQARLRFDLGDSYLALRQYALAKEAYEQFVVAAPHDGLAEVARGKIAFAEKMK